MKWEELDKEQSRVAYEEFCSSGNVTCPSEYVPLRDELCQMFVETLSEIGIEPEDIQTKNYAYQVDYIFGLKLYALFTEEYQMSLRLAATEGVWRFLSVMVVPDIIALRYGKDHPDRFWKKPKRLWLRVIWWYIYLSWQGDASTTAEILKDNSTDEILQLVDRCGRGGYRVSLYREFMKKYSELGISERRQKQIFRKMMVLNTARVQVIEPALVDGGERRYVDDLCNYFLTA